MDAIVMTKRPKAEDMAWGERKVGRQFIITETASEKIDRLAAQGNISRSEFIERSIRWLDEHWDGQLQREIGAAKEGEL